MKMDLSVVLGVRNRDENMIGCLTSLAEQKNPDNISVEFIVIDYGGTGELKRIVQRFKNKMEIKYIPVKEYGVFNESRSKNIGVKLACGELILCTNADILFSPNVLSLLWREYKKYGKNKLFILQRFHLDKSGFTRKEDFLFDQWREQAKLGPKSACGDFQASHYENWYKMRGYDEKMVGWGAMDIDFVERLLSTGVKEHWLDIKKVQIYHQHHEVVQPKLKHAVNLIYKNARKGVVNPGRWGKIEQKVKLLIVGKENEKTELMKRLNSRSLKDTQKKYTFHSFDENQVKSVLEKKGFDYVVRGLSLNTTDNFLNYITKSDLSSADAHLIYLTKYDFKLLSYLKSIFMPPSLYITSLRLNIIWEQEEWIELFKDYHHWYREINMNKFGVGVFKYVDVISKDN